MSYLMGIDLGTSGVKVLIINTVGEVISTETVEYDLYHPHNGWAEQDPNEWWAATQRCIRRVIDQSEMDTELIQSIGLTGQMHGLVMLDEDNQVIRPSIIWCDQRTEKECVEITEKVGAQRLVEITANPALTGFTASKIMWVKNNEPENYEKCRHILLPKDFIRFKLTGEYATDVSDASGMQLLDVRKRKWSEEVLDALEIEESLLGIVYESPEITGKVTVKASGETGLPAGLCVVAGAGDNAAAAVGTGVVTDQKAFTTIGTSGVVFAHTSELKIDPMGRVHTFCCAVPGAWHVMGVTQAAGLSLKWYLDQHCNEIKEEAKNKEISHYDLMAKMAEDIPIGANRLLYLPYLMGERTPHLDPHCRGVFFGLSTIHAKSDTIRAIFEGVTYSLRDCYEILKEMNVTIDSMIASGGGAASRFWRQMMADVFACSVLKVNSSQGPAFGAAILAGVGSGVFASVEEACSAMIQVVDKSEVDPDRHVRYQEFYQLYQALYPALKENFIHLSGL